MDGHLEEKIAHVGAGGRWVAGGAGGGGGGRAGGGGGGLIMWKGGLVFLNYRSSIDLFSL